MGTEEKSTSSPGRAEGSGTWRLSAGRLGRSGRFVILTLRFASRVVVPARRGGRGGGKGVPPEPPGRRDQGSGTAEPRRVQKKPIRTFPGKSRCCTIGIAWGSNRGLGK